MSDTKVITGLVRFSYASVFEPKAASEGSEPKYSVQLLIPKKNKETLKAIEEAVNAAAVLGKAGKFNNKDPKKISNFKWPLRDGDEEKADEDENYKGMMFLNASSAQKPQVVDADRDPIGPEDFYSGCWGRASINFYAYSVNGNRGIAAGLNNLQKRKDDENLTGRASAESEFDDGFESDDDLMG